MVVFADSYRKQAGWEGRYVRLYKLTEPDQCSTLVKVRVFWEIVKEQ